MLRVWRVPYRISQNQIEPAGGEWRTAHQGCPYRSRLLLPLDFYVFKNGVRHIGTDAVYTQISLEFWLRVEADYSLYEGTYASDTNELHGSLIYNYMGVLKLFPPLCGQITVPYRNLSCRRGQEGTTYRCMTLV